MKTIALILLLTSVSLSAQASSMYISCSNSDQTVKTVDGHVSPHVIVTEIDYESDRKETPIKLEYGDYKMESLDSKELHTEQQKACNEESGIGWASSTQVSYARVKITKTDGSLFSQNVDGVSKDRKSVGAFLICERQVSNQMPCKKK